MMYNPHYHVLMDHYYLNAKYSCWYSQCFCFGGTATAEKS